MPELSAIWIYPVKAAAGVALTEARVEARGLAGDRRWMIVDPNGRFLTQREHPRLALLKAHAAGGALRLEAPAHGALDVPVPPPDGAAETVQVWRDTVEATPAGAEADAWLSAFVGAACRLVYMPDASTRPVDPAYGRPGDHVSFADGYPVLLAAEASLADLNGRLDAPVPMNRFRPNLVVRGSEPFAEDTWRRIRIGDVAFRVVKPCARCTVPTVDQATGVAGKEPLRTLSRYRKKDGKVYFAQNLIAEQPGTLRSGDAVEVLETGPSIF